MILPRPFIQFMGRELARRLSKDACQFKDPQAIGDLFGNMIAAELEAEDRIHEEARGLLDQYAEYMRANNITYSEMLQRVKKNLMAERKVTPASSRDGQTKVSREKILELSHTLAGKLPRLEGVRVVKGWNDVRHQIALELTNILVMEKKVDERASQLIRSQKREILEGGEEWNVLHRRFYEQEMARLGVQLSAPKTPQR